MGVAVGAVSMVTSSPRHTSPERTTTADKNNRQVTEPLAGLPLTGIDALACLHFPNLPHTVSHNDMFRGPKI